MMCDSSAPNFSRKLSYPSIGISLMSNHDSALWLRNGVAQRARSAKSLH
jgi:hypothetical protein